jgi:hypothetical protein
MSGIWIFKVQGEFRFVLNGAITLCKIFCALLHGLHAARSLCLFSVLQVEEPIHHA